jgi:RNA polymerase sigma-70 factor (ECF subfamily)
LISGHGDSSKSAAIPAQGAITQVTGRLVIRVEDDVTLLEDWRRGSAAAGEALFGRYYAAVARFFANKVTTDPGDLIQETFLACVKGREALRDAAAFRSYLFATAYNSLRYHYRKQSRAREQTDFAAVTMADLAPGVGTMMGKHAEQRLLLAALRRIPVESQTLLELFYWEDLTSAQMADALGVPHGTIRTRLRKARALLEEALRAVANADAPLVSTLGDLDGWAKGLREQRRER